MENLDERAWLDRLVNPVDVSRDQVLAAQEDILIIAHCLALRLHFQGRIWRVQRQNVLPSLSKGPLGHCYELAEKRVRTVRPG